jgi:hypothetical protein
MVFQLFHLLGIDTYPDRPDADPEKWCESDPIRIRIHNTDLQAIFSRATVPVDDKPDDYRPPTLSVNTYQVWIILKSVNQNPRATWAFVCVGEGLRYLGFGRPTFSGASSYTYIGTNVLCTVKSSNVVIVFAQNNFFLHNLWRLPHVFLWGRVSKLKT